jgi:hypothetical protein
MKASSLIVLALATVACGKKSAGPELTTVPLGDTGFVLDVPKGWSVDVAMEGFFRFKGGHGPQISESETRAHDVEELAKEACDGKTITVKEALPGGGAVVACKGKNAGTDTLFIESEVARDADNSIHCLLETNIDPDQALAICKSIRCSRASCTAPGPATPWTTDAAAVQAKLQGDWLLKDHAGLGSLEAVEVKGDQFKIWNAQKNADEIFTLKVEAPCQYSLTQRTKDGSSGTTSHYVIDGDTFHVGLGDTAVKQGNMVVACVSNGIFVLDGGKCTKYHLWGRKLSSEDTTCSVDGTTLKVKSDGTDYTLDAHGSVWATDQLWNTPAPEKVASYDEAKAKVKAAK